MKYVVFDAVGTIIDARPSVTRAYHEYGKLHGSRYTHDQVAKRFSDRWADPSRNLFTSEELEFAFWKSFVAEVLDDVKDFDSCFEQLHDHFAKPESWRLFDDVEPTIHALEERGISVAVASNFDQRLRGVLAGLLSHSPFETLFISSEVGFRKPADEFYQHVIAQLGVSAADILFVGDDALNDLEAPRRHGMQSVQIDRGMKAAESKDVISSLATVVSRIEHDQPV